MTQIDWYGLAGMAAVALSFYVLHRIAHYLFACALVILAFAWATRDILVHMPAQWIVMGAGLCLSAFGLLIIRVMLTRSVSLHLLPRLQASLDDEFASDIGSRLNDMRGFGLIRDLAGNKVTLTSLGHVVGRIVGTLYAIFRIKG